MWQELITGIILIAALFYLARRFFMGGREPGGCEKCVGKVREKSPDKN